MDFILKKAVGQRDRVADLEFHAIGDRGHVVHCGKVGSPDLLIGRHRHCRTIRIAADASIRRPESE